MLKDGVSPFQGLSEGDRLPRALPCADEFHPFGVAVVSPLLVGELHPFGMVAVSALPVVRLHPFERRLSQRLQSAAVVSDRSSGQNQSFIGHACSNLTSPRLRRVDRLSRYSPRASRSITNTCPGSMPSRCRMAAGKTILPLVETMMRIPVVYRTERPEV